MRLAEFAKEVGSLQNDTLDLHIFMDDMRTGDMPRCHWQRDSWSTLDFNFKEDKRGTVS